MSEITDAINAAILAVAKVSDAATDELKAHSGAMGADIVVNRVNICRMASEMVAELAGMAVIETVTTTPER